MLSIFERFIDPFPVEVPDRPPQTLLAFIWHYAKPVWPYLALISLSGALFAAIEVALFGFLGNLVDFLATADRSTFWTDHWWWLLGVALVVLVVMPLTDFAHELVTNQCVMANFPMRTRWMAHRYVLRQSMSFFQDDFAGRIATKVMQTALAVRQVMTLATNVFVYIIVYFLGALVLFAQSDWRLVLPLALWLAAYAAAMRYFVPRLRVVAKEQAEARSLFTGRIVDTYTNMQTVKLFAHAAREESYAKDSMMPFLINVRRQFRYITGLNFTLEVLNGLLLLSVGAIGIWLWTQSAATAGAVALSIGLVLRLKGMSHWVMWEIASLFENIGVVQDGMGTIARDIALVDKPAAPRIVVRHGALQFEHVKFHYGKEGGVIEDLSLRVAAGEKVGLVGRSGAGKSTLVNLLLRFYDPESGQILIDGQDIAAVTQDSLRAAIGMVSQDTSLLHRSVRDNIRYGRPDSDHAEITAAAAAVRADEFIADLTDMRGRTGYDAHVGERGVKLSGGQRQRIAIARVLLKNAPILILDEATSALDSEVEAAIQEHLYNLMTGKTVIAIAHRLSTIAAMDRLVIMDKGAIVEEGTHAELLKRDGIYAQLWSRQSGGFLATEVAA